MRKRQWLALADELLCERVRFALVLVVDFLLADFLLVDFLLVAGFFFFAGTLPPARRASERPIAIACLRLLTFLPERPLFNVPLLRSFIAFSTFSEAFLPYLLAMSLSLFARGPNRSLPSSCDMTSRGLVP